MSRLDDRRRATALAARPVALTHRLAALLLEYPGPDQAELLPKVLTAAQELAPHLRDPLLQTAAHLATTPLAELQAEYVTTFDLRRRCALYLTYFAYGDTRRRGVALVEIKQAYRRAGYVLAVDELPDHLPVVLEFAAAAPVEGLTLLLGHRAGLELLRLALLDSDSPWAGAVAAVCATLPQLSGDERAAVAALAAQGPPGEEVGLEPFDPSMPTAGARR